MRQAIAFAIDRERINQIASRGTAFPGHGLLPMYYKDFYTEPAGDSTTRTTPTGRTSCSTTRAGRAGEGGVREKDGQRLSFDLYVRSESQEQHPGRAAA